MIASRCRSVRAADEGHDGREQLLGALAPTMPQALVLIIFVPDSRRGRVPFEVGRIELDFPEIGVIQDPLSVRDSRG